MLFIIRRRLKSFLYEERKLLIAKITENDFFTIINQIMIIKDFPQIYFLSNKEVQELYGGDISKINKRKRGMSAREFLKIVGHSSIGYRIFDSRKRSDHFAGNVVTDDKNHGIYFTIDKKEVFRYILSAALEDFGDSIAEISFINKNGNLVRDARIAKGNDTDGCYKAHRFYIKSVYSLNDCRYINDFYDESYSGFQELIKDESEHGLYRKSVNYFLKKGMCQAAKALKDIHEMRQKENK